MTKDELYEEIKNSRTFCIACQTVKEGVLREGIEFLDKYDGMQCNRVVNWMLVRPKE